MKDAKQPDGDALIRAKRRGGAHFKKEVERQRNLGFSDPQLVQAMVKSNVLLDPLGSKPPLRRPR